MAKKYDVMNDSMTLGVHRVWKDVLVRKMNPSPGTLLLDVAGGTGKFLWRVLHDNCTVVLNRLSLFRVKLPSFFFFFFFRSSVFLKLVKHVLNFRRELTSLCFKIPCSKALKML